MDFRAFIIANAIACLPSSGSTSYTTVFQQSGIQGKVYQISGNQMPSPRRSTASPADSSRGSKTPSSPLPQPEGPGVKAVICIFALTNDSQVTRQGTSPYCEAVHTHLIRQANTDEKGNFTILLPPGTYSVFTKKGDLFYATRRDEKNNIAPVEVLPGKMTRVDCKVESDHKVFY